MAADVADDERRRLAGQWRINLDFSALQGHVGPDFTTLAPVPTGAVRKMRWTWAPDQQPGRLCADGVSSGCLGLDGHGSQLAYQVAGPGSRRIEDDSAALAYCGSWEASVVGNYSGGSIRATQTPTSSVSYTYTEAGSHTLYLGTRMFQNGSTAGAQIQITIDGAAHGMNLALAGEDVLVRIKVADLGARTARRDAPLRPARAFSISISSRSLSLRRPSPNWG